MSGHGGDPALRGCGPGPASPPARRYTWSDAFSKITIVSGRTPSNFIASGPGLGLQELLEGFHVGYFQDQPHSVGLRGIGEELARDAHAPEELLPLGRVKPVVDVVHFADADIRCHDEPPGLERD